MGDKLHKGWNIRGMNLGDGLTKLLTDDWEPYAMTESVDGTIFWVKKYIQAVDAPLGATKETAGKWADWPWYYMPCVGSMKSEPMIICTG